MSKSPPILTAAAIHSVYSSKKIDSVVENATTFQSTQRFIRDPAHTGHAPLNPKGQKGDRRR